MIEFFRHIPEQSTGVLNVGQWPFIQKGLLRNLEKIQQYHHTYNKGVKSNHFLVRLLQSVSVPKSLPIERYYANVDAIALNVSMAMRMTSSIYRGIVHRGIFYGENTPEILLATDDYFDFEQVHNNWENACPVTVLMNGKSDMGMHLPDGKSYSEEQGLSVFLVNISMLCVMYRAFLQKEQAMEDSPKSVMQFIGGYVIPNMLASQTEVCFFNRVYKEATGVTDNDDTPNRKHPFALQYYDGYIDHAVLKTLEYIERTNLSFMTVLKTIPSLKYDSMYEALEMPDLAPTLQVDFALVLTRLKVIDFLFYACKDRLLERNQAIVNQILRAFRVNNVYDTFASFLPPDVMREANVYIGNILLGAEREFF